jgi:hypothetical protein
MSKIILRKKSFPARIKVFSHIDEEGRACYKPVLSVVSGDVFDYIGHKWGIYRTAHTKDKSRKNDYILVDLATGLPVWVDSRRINILEDLETAWFKQALKDSLEAPGYAENVRRYEELKRGAGL